MATTTPDSLWSPDDVDTFDQLHADLATMQGSVQTALKSRAMRSYRWDNESARLAQTGMVDGDLGYQNDTLMSYMYVGGAWVATGDTGWINLAFGSGWSSYIPTTWGDVSYRRIGPRVTLRGIPTTSSTGLVIGTLPVGFRPKFNLQVSGWYGNGANAFPTIAASGDISIASSPGGTVTISWGQPTFLIN